jgi:dCTP deaminase
MILSDKDIKKSLESGQIVVDPLFPSAIQPASVDVHLGADFLIFEPSKHIVIDPKESVDDMMKEVTIDENNQFILHPGEFALGMTYEVIGLGNDVVGHLNGKSSLGRIGLIVHATAGFIDPGNKLKITLELHNIANMPIKLYYKMPIGQMIFMQLSSEAEVPYGKGELGSKYYGAYKPQASQYYKNFTKNNQWMTFK